MQFWGWFICGLGSSLKILKSLMWLIISIHYPLVNTHSYWTWPFIVEFPIKMVDHDLFGFFIDIYQKIEHLMIPTKDRFITSNHEWALITIKTHMIRDFPQRSRMGYTGYTTLNQDSPVAAQPRPGHDEFTLGHKRWAVRESLSWIICIHMYI